MLTYLPTLAHWQFVLLCESGERGGMGSVEVSEHLLSGRWKCFSVGKDRGLVAVSVRGVGKQRKMIVEAFWARNFGWFMRAFRDVMDDLATAWDCHTVETMCFDSRLAAAMVKIEAKPTAWQMEWQVRGMEKRNGQ